MRLCNETITVFNARFDPVSDYDVYVGTIISGVSWYCDIASAVDGSGLKAADKFTIRVPTDADFGGKQYVDPVQYGTANPATAFTLRSGDIIVKGAVNPDDPRPAILHKDYSNVMTVLSVTDNRRAPNAPHWKVVGT